MGYTCKDQALLVAISSRGNHVLGVFGDEAKSEIDWYEGEIDQFLSPEGVEDDGLYVWEGEIRCGFKEPDDTTWHGDWRPARVGDLERFGLRGLEAVEGGAA